MASLLAERTLPALLEGLSVEMEAYQIDHTLIVADWIDNAAEKGGYNWAAIHAIAAECGLTIDPLRAQSQFARPYTVRKYAVRRIKVEEGGTDERSEEVLQQVGLYGSDGHPVEVRQEDVG